MSFLFMLIAVQTPKPQRGAISLSKLEAWSSSLTKTSEAAYLGFLPSKKKHLQRLVCPNLHEESKITSCVLLHFSRDCNRRLAN